MRTPRRGPFPTFPNQISIRIGESFFRRWELEAENSKIPMAQVGRIAIDSYFSQAIPVICPVKLEEEASIRVTAQVNDHDLGRINERASLLQLSSAQLTSMAIASRYIETVLPDAAKTELALTTYVLA